MTSRERRIALVIFAMLLPCLAALFWSGQLASGVARPGALRTFQLHGEDHAAFFFGDALHLLGPGGDRLARLPLAEIGLREEPTDMDWTVGPGGRVQAWFFEDTTPRIVRCDLQPAPPKLVACAQALAGPMLKAQPSSSAVHLAVDIANARVFVADARGQAVRAFTLHGQSLGESGRELFFPNRLRIAGEQLVVADNDHRQLAWFGIAGERPGFPLLRTLSTASHPQAAGQRKAADFAFQRRVGAEPPGLWLLAVAQGQKDGQVLLFDGDWNPQGVGNLGGHRDPLVVDRLGDALLVADFDGIALYRIGADGRFLGTFGNGTFAEELGAARSELRQARWWQWGAWAGLALTLLAGFALALRHGEKPGAQEAQAAFARLQQAEAAVPLDSLELKPARWHRRRLALASAGLGALPVAVLAALALLAPWEIPPEWRPGGAATFAGLLLAAAMAVAALVWFAWRRGKRRLWLGRGRIEVRLGRQRLAQASPSQLRASPRWLLVGGVVLPYRAGRTGRWIYDEGNLVRYLLAHLKPEQWMTDGELVRGAVRR
jgi:hypothetical protein